MSEVHWILLVSGLAAGLLIALVPLQCIGHILAIILRAIRRKPLMARRIIFLRTFLFFTLPIAAVFLVGATIAENINFRDASTVFGTFAIIGFLIIGPLWTLVAAFRRRGEGFSSGAYVATFLSVLAMPVLAGMFFLTTVWVGYGITSHTGEHYVTMMDEVDRSFFRSQEVAGASTCSRVLKVMNGTSKPLDRYNFWSYMPDQVEFWFDQSLSGALFDFVEVFDCRLSRLTNNPDHAAFSAVVFVYRLFAELFLVALVFVPLSSLTRILRRFFGRSFGSLPGRQTAAASGM